MREQTGIYSVYAFRARVSSFSFAKLKVFAVFFKNEIGSQRLLQSYSHTVTHAVLKGFLCHSNQKNTKEKDSTLKLQHTHKKTCDWKMVLQNFNHR